MVNLLTCWWSRESLSPHDYFLGCFLCWCLPSHGVVVWGMFSGFKLPGLQEEFLPLSRILQRIQSKFASKSWTITPLVRVQPNQGHVDKRTPFSAINLNHQSLTKRNLAVGSAIHKLSVREPTKKLEFMQQCCAEICSMVSKCVF